MWSSLTPQARHRSWASVSAGASSSPAKTEKARRSGSRPSHSGLVRNSQDQEMASFLK